MPLFRLNKSQASIDRLSSSRDGSPTTSEADYPQNQNQQPAVYHGSQFAHNQHPDRFDQQSFDDRPYQNSQGQTHPAHVLTRSQSQRAPQPGDVYATQRPSVNIIPPLNNSNTILEDHPSDVLPGHTTFGQSRQVHTEKEHKKSKRSIFGLTSSKDKEKERDRDRKREKETSPIERRGVGRSGSFHLLRKNPQSPVQVSTESAPQSPQQATPNYQSPGPPTYEAPADGTESNGPEDSTYYEQFHRPHPGPIEPSHNQGIHQSPDYVEDAPHFSSPKDQYQPYHQTESANTSEQYLPYQGHLPQQGSLSQDPHQNLRPPSQLSLGPPSPIANPSAQSDSRPSTATTSRYSAQSTGQPPAPPQQQQQLQQPQGLMARGDPGNGSLRQHISQREHRGEDPGQYQGQQDPRIRMSQQVSEQGRSTPPPRTREDIGNLDYHQLLQRHEDLQAKYSKVKRYYFEREAQVTQLQNTVANQRLSMSKTSLDDAQYAARFERLSGAIMNLSFNIRKNWRSVPPWLRAVSNQDAHNVGTKEMTAIGRACITRWLFETVFERTFHPGIDASVSGGLKNIERNLRRAGQASAYLTDEQRDDMTIKIINWRLTTIEGLQDVLSSRQAEHYSETLTKHLTLALTESLKANLTEPPPPGLNEGVSTIIDQAVGIAANLPLESRDVCIDYFMPGAPVNETYMKLETGIPPLTNPGSDERMSIPGSLQQSPQQHHEGQDPGDGMSSTSNEGDRDVEAEIREATGKATQLPGSIAQSAAQQQRADSVSSMQSSGSQSTIKSSDKSTKKSSFLGGFVNKKPAPQIRSTAADSRLQQYGDNAADSLERDRAVRESMAIDPNNLSSMQPSASNEGKIRFAVFLSVEVRGKGAKGDKDGSNGSGGASGSGRDINILVKAPVYEF